ncbi:ankyrin repeat-containing domain protein [Aspergillus germanicus]
MLLIHLPLNLLTEIVDLLEYEDEINSLARTCKCLYGLVNPLLYKHNVRHGKSSALFWAIVNAGEIATVTKILDAGASPNEKEQEQDLSAVALAAKHGNEASFLLLVQRGADLSWDTECNPSSPDKSGRLFSLAATNGHVSMLPLLMGLYAKDDNGVCWPIVHGGGQTLTAAAGDGHRGVVEFLLDHGADVNYQSEVSSTMAARGSTPLHEALINGHIDIAMLLLDRGADATLQAYREGTLICCAARNGYLDIVRMHADRGGLDSSLARNSRGELHRALMWPLLWAAEKSHTDVVDYLLERVDYIRLIQAPEDQAAFLAAAVLSNKLDLVRELLDNHHYDPNGRWTNVLNFRSSDYPTALCWAASRGHAEIVRLLLEHGADLYPHPLIYQRRVALPLPEAVCNGHEQVVDLLLKAGADPNGKLPSSDAAMAPPNRRADLGACIEGGEPTVGLVIASGNIDEIQMLLDSGVDLVQYLEPNYSLLEFAVRGGKAVLEWLLQQGRWDEVLSPQGKSEDELEKGFSVRFSQPKCNLFFSAAASLDIPSAHPRETLKWLLDHGAPQSELDEALFRVPTHQCLHQRSSTRPGERFCYRRDCNPQPDILRILLNAGANPLAHGGYAIVALRQNIRTVQMILEAVEAGGGTWEAVGSSLREAEEFVKRHRFHNRKIVKILRQSGWRLRYPVS